MLRTNVLDKWNVQSFERMSSYEQYPEEKSRLWSSSFKIIDQPSWRTTRRNYKHIPQIVCISSRFRVLHLLWWEFEQFEILWRYTVILVCINYDFDFLRVRKLAIVYEIDFFICFQSQATCIGYCRAKSLLNLCTVL